MPKREYYFCMKRIKLINLNFILQYRYIQFYSFIFILKYFNVTKREYYFLWNQKWIRLNFLLQYFYNTCQSLMLILIWLYAAKRDIGILGAYPHMQIWNWRFCASLPAPKDILTGSRINKLDPFSSCFWGKTPAQLNNKVPKERCY